MEKSEIISIIKKKETEAWGEYVKAENDTGHKSGERK